VQVLHILREALTNIRQHARAERVQLQIRAIAGQAIFTLEDDGRGFDLNQPSKTDHFGLQIMRTRAERSGGGLRVISAPGGGTRIEISFPLRTFADGGLS
jgi:two-component system nitrate/nitrite sensor histidine kinase NarX